MHCSDWCQDCFQDNYELEEAIWYAHREMQEEEKRLKEEFYCLRCRDTGCYYCDPD